MYIYLFKSTFPNVFFGFPLSFRHLSFSPVSGHFILICGCHLWEKTWNTLHDWVLCSGYSGLLCFQIRNFLPTLCEEYHWFWWLCMKFVSISVLSGDAVLSSSVVFAFLHQCLVVFILVVFHLGWVCCYNECMYFKLLSMEFFFFIDGLLVSR